MSKTKYKIFYERNLPHYQPAGSTIFVTFRLAGSLPRSTLIRLSEEAKRLENEAGKSPHGKVSRENAYLVQKKIFGLWDNQLDKNINGSFWLSNPDIAQMVWSFIHEMDGNHFILDALCIMPNHVHLVCTPLKLDENFLPLSKILRYLKGSTARQANKILNRRGQFWQHESYDHVIRDEEELDRIVYYVLENPVMAGLEAKWVYSRFELE